MRWVKRIYTWDMPSLPKLMDLVCEEFEVTEHDMIGSSRKRNVVDARMAFVSLARFNMKITTTTLGQRLNLDHATVLNLINRMADYEFLNHPVVQRVKKIEQLFKPTI